MAILRSSMAPGVLFSLLALLVLAADFSPRAFLDEAKLSSQSSRGKSLAAVSQPQGTLDASKSAMLGSQSPGTRNVPAGLKADTRNQKQAAAPKGKTPPSDCGAPLTRGQMQGLNAKLREFLVHQRQAAAAKSKSSREVKSDKP